MVRKQVSCTLMYRYEGHVLSQTIFRINLYPTKVISEFSSRIQYRIYSTYLAC
jgi:hypothetical protein